jgi:hypothetical protein
MLKSLFFIWLRWAIWVTLFSTAMAAVFSFAIVLYMYISKGALPLSSEVRDALVAIGSFWFAILWSITLPLSTFFGMKQLFKGCYDAKRLQLFTCKKEPIDKVGYEDLIKVWRKWLFLMIWGVAAQLLFMTGIEYLLSDGGELMGWFNVYVLYVLVMSASLVTLFVLLSRCKLVELKRC